MLRTNHGNYWKSARVLRKNNYNCTKFSSGDKGDTQIANLFKDKYELLFNSVQCSEDELHLIETQVESDVKHVYKILKHVKTATVFITISSVVITSELQSAN